jgi:hypothetical protein
MGVSNFVGDFNITDGTTGPNAVYRWVTPFSSLLHGYSATDPDGISVGDYSALINQGNPATTPLYPITAGARMWDKHVIPIIQDLFGAGLTTNPSTSKEIVTRYVGMIMSCYQLVYSARVLNHLAFHADWTRVYPYTGIVPSHLYALAKDFDCDDIGFATHWAPLADRIERHVMFPFMIQESKRMLSPMLSLDINGRVLIPSSFQVLSDDAASLRATIDARLLFVDAELSDGKKAFRAYIPFPMSEQSLWEVSEPEVDVMRMSGWYNSGNRLMAVFDDTNDPEEHRDMVSVSGETNTFLYYSLFPQPTWGEIRNSTVFGLNSDIVDDTYELLTPHRWGPIAIIDEYNQSVVWDGVPVADTTNAFELINFIYNRFPTNDSDVAFGLAMPGYLGAYVQRQNVERVMIGEVLQWASAPVLKAVSEQMTGASLREIRSSIKSLASNAYKG